MRTGGIVLAVFLCGELLGGVSDIDFSAWDGVSASPASGWTLDGVRKMSDTGRYWGGAGFCKKGARVSSPTFSAPLTKVTVEVCTATTTPCRMLNLFPVVSGSRSEEGILLSPHTGGYASQVIDLASCKAESFDLELGGGSNGNWYVMRIIAEAEGEPIEQPAETATNAFTAVRWGLGDSLDRTADFSFTESVRAKTPWQNGTDGDGFLAFTDTGAACLSIKPNTGRSTTAGLYATATNETGQSFHVLSMLGTSGSGLSLLLPVRLDAARNPDRLTLAYRSHQVSFPTNGVVTTNAFSWCVLDEWNARALAAAVWRPAPEGDYVTAYNGGARPARFCDASAERTLSLPVTALRKHAFLCFRWTVPKQARSAMMGLSNVRVTATLRPPGLCLYLR